LAGVGGAQRTPHSGHMGCSDSSSHFSKQERQNTCLHGASTGSLRTSLQRGHVRTGSTSVRNWVKKNPPSMRGGSDIHNDDKENRGNGRRR
jgi:hypothetical protein